MLACCGILVPQPGIEPMTSTVKRGVLTTWLPKNPYTQDNLEGWILSEPQMSLAGWKMNMRALGRATTELLGMDPGWTWLRQ